LQIALKGMLDLFGPSVRTLNHKENSTAAYPPIDPPAVPGGGRGIINVYRAALR